MNIEHSAYQALMRLRDASLDDKRAREIALRYLEDSLEHAKNSATQTKDWLLQMATESKRTKFKLIARVNTSGLELMEWCDDIHNFDGMCSSAESIKEAKGGRYVKRTYTLEELPQVIDNALDWYNHVKLEYHDFNSTMLHILAVDDVIIQKTNEEILDRYNDMLEQVVETLKNGHTVEFVNLKEIMGNNKLLFHFYKYRQVISDLKGRVNLSEYKIHGGSRKFIVSYKYLDEFIKRDYVKERLKNWNDFGYPDWIFEDIASENLTDGDVVSYLD